MLAAIAARTSRVTLASGVTVLSTGDPVRVCQRFATLDALSNGRAEIQVGRGSFTESFELFGYDLTDWVVRTARYGLPMMLAIIGGPPARFATFVELFHTTVAELGTGGPDGRLPVGVHSPGFVAETDELARELAFPHDKANRDRIGRERGWGEMTREHFDAEADSGALVVGSPQTVARRIAATMRALGVDRFDLKLANGPQPHADLMRAIELYGTQVVPMVRDLLA